MESNTTSADARPESPSKPMESLRTGTTKALRMETSCAASYQRDGDLEDGTDAHPVVAEVIFDKPDTDEPIPSCTALA